jgi:hypothetical protein
VEALTATEIELADLELSAHACDRYVERIRPALERESGARELARLICEQGRLVADPPGWLAERQRAEPADAYVVVGDDLVLPVRISGGRFPVAVAVTCLDRSGVSELARAGRNRRRRARAARRRDRRAGGTQPRRRR